MDTLIQTSHDMPQLMRTSEQFHLRVGRPLVQEVMDRMALRFRGVFSVSLRHTLRLSEERWCFLKNMMANLYQRDTETWTPWEVYPGVRLLPSYLPT